MKTLSIFLLLVLLLVSVSYGQQRTIVGTITSAVDGKPVKGVKIVLVKEKFDEKNKGIILVETKIATKTNGKGEYTLIVPDTYYNTIRIQKHPYTTLHVQLGLRTEFNSSLTLRARKHKM